MFPEITPHGVAGGPNPEAQMRYLESKIVQERQARQAADMLAAEALARAEQAETAMHTDELTGLLSRASLERAVDERIIESQPTGLLFLDLDAFKAVNDTLGHQEGDRLLQDFAEFVTITFRREGEAAGIAGRLGGDEIGVVVNLEGRGDETDQRAPTVPARMHRAVEHFEQAKTEFIESLDLTIQRLGFDVSVGAAVLGPGMSTEDLFSLADEKMYAAKMQRKLDSLTPEERLSLRGLSPRQIVALTKIGLRNTILLQAVTESR